METKNSSYTRKLSRYLGIVYPNSQDELSCGYSNRNAYKPNLGFRPSAINDLASPLISPVLLLALDMCKSRCFFWFHTLIILVVQLGQAICANVDKIAVWSRYTETGEWRLLKDGIDNKILAADERGYVSLCWGDFFPPRVCRLCNLGITHEIGVRIVDALQVCSPLLREIRVETTA